ncbi:TorD/DmsD family molecular chaperone [Aestuariimicrobium sp. Y1814]|uniref:TorD/DmsD family molecular chaperone n=1 Tax=Aestuariimicrobium sp. Y1814 TaxID=3418742 RepID=UPI003DA6DCCF
MTSVDLGTPHRVPSTDELDAIAAVCAFLANLLLRVESAPEVVANLDATTIAAWPMAGRNEATRVGLNVLARAVEQPATTEELAADYRRLFVGPGPIAAPPWESVHVDEEGLMFQEPTMLVRHAYGEFGLQAPALNKEPDDHMGLELAFIGELAVAALHAAESGDVVGQATLVSGITRFWEEHLSVWGETLSSLVVDAARTDLYRALGHLLGGSIAAIGTILGR